MLFTPPRWPMLEFDASRRPSQGSRWMPSWQGVRGKPADEVCLGWVAPGEQAVVATAALGRHPSIRDRRSNALFLVLGGDQLLITSRPSQRGEIHAQLHTVPDDAQRWHSVDVIVDGVARTAEVLEYSENVTVGYVTLDDRTGTFAVAGLPTEDVELRTLTQDAAESYPVNPMTAADAETLNQQQRPEPL